MKKIFIRKEHPIPFTREGYEKLQEEKKTLLSQRPEAVEHLRKAREMGDLSENGYYKASRSRLSFLDAQLRRVDRLLRAGVVVKPSGTGIVDIGSTVTMTDGAKESTYMIVGGYESDPQHRTISHLSPIGKALIERKAGDKIEVTTPSGVVTYTILRVV